MSYVLIFFVYICKTIDRYIEACLIKKSVLSPSEQFITMLRLVLSSGGWFYHLLSVYHAPIKQHKQKII